MSLTQNNLDTLEVLIRVTASLSLLGISFLLADVSRNWGQIRGAPSRIILWWTVATASPLPAMILARAEIPGSKTDPSALCTGQAVMLTFGLLSSAAWAGCMALNIYLVVIRKFTMSGILKAETYYHFFAWGVPLLVAMMPLMAPGSFSGRSEPFYGDASLWCWISNPWAPFRMYYFFGPLWIGFSFTLVVYGAVGITVLRTFNQSESAVSNSRTATQKHLQARMTFVVRTSLYLAAFIITYSGATINRLTSIVTDKAHFSLFVLNALTIPSGGVWAALAYFGGQVLSCFGSRKRTGSQGKANMDEDWTNESGSSGGSGSKTATSADSGSHHSSWTRPIMVGGHMLRMERSDSRGAGQRQEKLFN